MFRLKHKKLLSRGVNLLFALLLGVMVLEGLVLKPGGVVIAWTILIGLVIVGGMGLVIPLEIEAQDQANRWYRAAYRAVWPFSALPGALIILSVVVWGIVRPTPGQFPVSGVLLITGMILPLVGILVVGGLAVTGYIAQGTEETRQWARSLGRTNGGARGGPAQEDTPPA